jgi:hypothetical protein
MSVIGNSAYGFWKDSISFCDAAHVWPETLSDIWSQHRNALFRAKDIMDV